MAATSIFRVKLMAFIVVGLLPLTGTRLVIPVSAQSEYNCLLRLEPMNDLYEGTPFDPEQSQKPITTATRFDLNILTNEFAQTTLFEPEGQDKPYPLYGEPSPDGTRMAYWGAKDQDHLFLAISEHPNFMADKQVTFAAIYADFAQWQPGWSSDSRYFAVLSEIETGMTARIYDSNLKLVALKKMPSKFIGWSSSGHELISVAPPGESRTTLDIYRFDPEQNTSTAFTVTVTDAAGFRYPFWQQSSNPNWLVLYTSDLGFYDSAAGTFQQVNSYPLARASGSGAIMSPQWSSDDRMLIYQEHNPDGEPEFGGLDDLVAFSPETGESQVLLRHMTGVEFSPDRHYAYVSYIVDTSERSSALIDLTTLETLQEFTEEFTSTWTEDSRFLILGPYHNSIDGMKWVDMSDNTVHEVNNFNTVGFRIDDIAASRWLTFHNEAVIDRNNVVTGGNSTQIGIVDLQTGDFQLVDQPQIQQSTFSPDGQILSLIQHLADDTLRVTLLALDGTVSNVLDLPLSGEWTGTVIWSPDSSQFALYLHDRPYPFLPRELYVFGADGSQILHRANLPDYFYLDQWTTCNAQPSP